MAKPGPFAELWSQRTAQLHVTKGIQSGEGLPPQKKPQKSKTKQNQKKTTTTDTIAKEPEWTEDGQRPRMVPTSVWGRKAGAYFPPRNGLFVENSFLVRSASSELCLLTWVLSCLQMCHFAALPSPRGNGGSNLFSSTSSFIFATFL